MPDADSPPQRTPAASPVPGEPPASSVSVIAVVPVIPAIPTSVRLLASLLVLLMTTGLFVGGAMPVAAGLLKPGWDKVAHVLVFAGLGMAYGLVSGRLGWRMLLWSVLGAVAVGSMDELHQLRLPGREPGWGDLLADAAGGLLGGLSLHLSYGWLRRRPAKVHAGQQAAA